MEPARFIVDISTELARTEPQLTSDFLTEFFVSWESVPEERRPLNLEYLSPWLYNLRTTVLLADSDGDKGRDKVASLLRKLVDVAILDENLTYSLGQHVWPSVAQDEVLLDIFLDELVKISITYGNRTGTLDVLSSVISGFGTVTVRGKIASRLRKTLNRSSLRPTRHLPDNSVWGEICVLLQLSLALSFDSRVQSQMFLPETFHIVTMLANTGTAEIRTTVHKLLVNTVHAICCSFQLEDARLLRIKALLDSISDPRGDLCAVLPPVVKDAASVSASLESGSTLSATEGLASMLFEMCYIASPSVDVANLWRCRWMSLVASTAFQNNPAVQPRAFAVMGCLAREEVDDDLLYQVLVALRNSISQFGEDGESEMLISIITSLSKMMTKLPSASRYGPQLFWLAMSLVRLVPSSLFNCTAQFLQSVLANIGTIGNITGEQLVPLLLQCRAQLEEAVLPLDDAYGIHFANKTFHFAVCACLVRGLTDTITRPSAALVLSSFLEMTSRPELPPRIFAGHPPHALPYLALLQARGLSYEEIGETSWMPNTYTDELPLAASRGWQNVDAMSDKELFLISAIQLVDFHYLEDAAQTRILRWIDDLATRRPAALVNLCVTPLLPLVTGVPCLSATPNGQRFTLRFKRANFRIGVVRYLPS